MIYFSHRTRKALADGHAYLPLGFAHYSYGSVAQKFQTLFSAAGLAAQELPMPEIYADAAHVAGGDASPTVHISFKPFDELRLLKGAVNIAHMAWEFDKLPQFAGLPLDHPRRRSIVHDYVHMLGLVDEVWVGCDYTKAVFATHGLTNVEVVPAPIEMDTDWEQEQPPSTASYTHKIGSLAFTPQGVAAGLNSKGKLPLDNATLFHAANCRAAGGRVFFSVFNTGDPRKNAAALFLGFQDHLRRTKRNDLLIVKLVLDSTPEALHNALARSLPKHFETAGVPLAFIDSPNILLVPGHLPADELAALYRCADFYVCTSAAEGQGLPVQEAMAAGLVPISSAATAMADYIKPDHAIILNTELAPVPLQVCEAYGLWGLTWRLAHHREVSRALGEAVRLPQEEIRRRALAARRFIHEHYGFAAITQKLRARIQELAA